MLPADRLVVFARAVLLPLLLALAVVLGPGSYFETSDDGTLAWLFAGVLALKPVVSVPLYLHGYGRLLAVAYAAWPAGSWLGLLLAVLLAAATALWFAVLERLLRSLLRPGWLLLALTFFFGLVWLEHWLWFSHARVALLLAAGGVLFAAQRAGRRGPLLLGLLALLAAWLVRPSLAALACGAVLPATVLLAGGWRRAAPLLAGVGLLLVIAFGINYLSQTPAESRVQARDVRLARILDYEQLRPFPRTTADSLGTAAVSLWLLGDSTTVDPALRGVVYQFDAGDFFGRVVPAKLALRAGLLLRDYFPVLLALLATAGAILRLRRPAPRGFWLVQLGFAAGLAGLAGILKLPPRLALPLLDCWLLTNLIFWLQALANGRCFENHIENTAVAGVGNSQSVLRLAGAESGAKLVARNQILRWQVGGAALVLLTSSLYAAKTWHRYQILQHERHRHESDLVVIGQQAGRVRVLAGTNDVLKSLSPFCTYYPGPGPVLLLTGWPAHDESQARLRQYLTGTADQTESLRRLARRAGPDSEVVWFLTPEIARWLHWRSGFGGAPLSLAPAAVSLRAAPSGPVREYRVRPSQKP